MLTRWLTPLAMVLVASMPGDAAAQGKFPPDTFVNLRVLPKDSTTPDVVAAMRNMTQALGVRCQFCHVGQEGQPLDQFDFIADTVDKKHVARSMMELVRTINVEVQKSVPTAAAVTCYTCHRGAPRPLHAPAPAKPGA
jgi:hypothetical protein